MMQETITLGSALVMSLVLLLVFIAGILIGYHMHKRK